MARLIQALGVALFHDTTGVHDERAIAEAGDQRQIVRDEDQAHAALGDQIVENAQHLGLHGDVERGGRFVGDQQVGLANQHHGDHHPLAHAARELMRIEAEHGFGIVYAHRFQHRQGAARAVAAIGLAMQTVGLHDLRADALHRIERIFGILHHHRQAFSAQAAPALLAKSPQIHAIEGQLAGADDPRRGDQAEDGAPRGRFAGAGLADDRQPLAPQGEADVARCAHRAAASGKGYVETFDFEQRRFAHEDFGSKASRNPSPNRLNPRLTTKIARPGIVATHH